MTNLLTQVPNPIVDTEERIEALIKELESRQGDNSDRSWAEHNAYCRKLYGYPTCDYCKKQLACFCQQCNVPTIEEIHNFVCHTCHADHICIETVRLCPTCHQKWPEEK